MKLKLLSKMYILGLVP